MITSFGTFLYTTGYRSGGYGLGISGARDDVQRCNLVYLIGGSGSILTSYDQEEVAAVELGL